MINERGVFGALGGAVKIMSRESPFANGELGKADLSFRIGDCASSASCGESVPDFNATVIRACRERMKLSRRCVYEVERVGTGWCQHDLK